ncbi:MAG: AMP-binding protein [SAR324 cluster bacterium]|nr:AMP-binding protein [SAR324 cluster bacterium]
MFEVKPDILKQVLERFADEQFLSTESQDWTFSDFFEEAILFSNSLNISPQKHIALCSAKPEFLLKTMLALWLKGAVVVPLNPKFPQKQKKELLLKTGSTLLEQVELNKISSKQHSSFSTLQSINPEAWASIIFTSGSSGSAKAVVHSLANHFYSALGANQQMPLNPGDRWLMSLPLYHVGGLAIFFRTLISGAAMVLPAEKQTLAEALINNKITHLSLVPTQLHRLLQTNVGKDSLLKLKLILLGGSAIPETLLDQSAELGLNVYTTYGSTEMASQVATGKKDLCRILPFREVRISSEDEAYHEIEVRGKTRFLGYLDESGLQQPFDQNGWFKTGDLGALEVIPAESRMKQAQQQRKESGKHFRQPGDAFNTLTVLGRKDSMFISGGENIHPEEIERVFFQSGMIEQAAVVPVQDVEFGARPVAFLQYAESASEAELVEFLQKELVSFKVPDLLLPWPEETGTGLKPKRKDLSRLAQTQFDLLQKNNLTEERPPYFEQWLENFEQGWKRVALSDGRQIFMLLDLRNKHAEKCLYIRADSRKEVMEWMLANENSGLLEIQNEENLLISWVPAEEKNRGLLKESFEIVRLLDDELPETEFHLYDACDRGSFNPSIFAPQRKIKTSIDKTKSGSSGTACCSDLVTELTQGWNWDFPEAVFQSTVRLDEFKRMYLLRCLYRRSGESKKFLGWKVHLLRDFTSSKNIENPFWNLSLKEEQALENILRQASFFTNDDYLQANTPQKERKRRLDFQAEFENLYN